ncbi:hypothetical protein G7046_g8140 [Stylonectria norvegica]|nr:hypothetical protein G7046_g8140 [Stylonectria norvegica]
MIAAEALEAQLIESRSQPRLSLATGEQLWPILGTKGAFVNFGSERLMDDEKFRRIPARPFHEQELASVFAISWLT